MPQFLYFCSFDFLSQNILQKQILEKWEQQLYFDD